MARIICDGNGKTHFRIENGDGRTVADIVAGVQCSVGDQVREYLASGSFHYSPPERSGPKVLVLVGFPFDPNRPEAIRGIAQLGFVSPTAEDAIRFAEQYATVRPEKYLVFLHRPWKLPHVDRHGYLTLGRAREDGTRGLYVRRQGGKWKDCLFAAAVPSN